MPRKTNDANNETITKKTTKSINNKSKASSSVKKTTSKDLGSNAKSVKKSTAKKTTTAKTAATQKKTTKKLASKATSSKSKVATSKSSTTKASTSRKSTKKNVVQVLEYYDLPYRYNQTVVKILAQTPNTLFVYWDISDEDKNNYIKEYGEFFFYNTKPVLVVHNLTLNYSFEIDINDYANSWYLHIKDSKCDYNIELGRRPINNYVSIPNNYLFISNSNNIESPNDHILFEKLPNTVLFRNVKTNNTVSKATIHYLAKINSTYNVKEFYKEMYKDISNLDKLDLHNPSSTFK